MAGPGDIMANHEAERERQEPGAGYNNSQRPAPDDLLLTAWAHILKVPQSKELQDLRNKPSECESMGDSSDSNHSSGVH